MSGERSRYGLLVSALGAVLLAVSVFLPWYGLSFTEAGAAAAQQASAQLAQQFGNSALQGALASTQSRIAGLAGHEFASLSAHQILHDLNVVLLVLAALALLDALVPLARAGASVPAGAGRAVVLLGTIATICVAYRMVHPPSAFEGLLALKLREGAWLALFGSLMMAVGGIWPRSAILRFAVEGEPVAAGSPFAALSGWTPEG
jgi:hypothetical protein